MARHAGRSRGCQICRQRRIKCDESLPECTQCKKNGKKCPGPITGTFYIITSDPVTWPSRLNSNHTIERPVYRSSPSSESSIRNETSDSSSLPIQSQLSLPTTHHPSLVESFTLLHFSHFFTTHGPSTVETLQSCSWLSKLPLLMSRSKPSQAMIYSVRATCMAFYGLLNNDASMNMEARRTYVKALQYRRRELMGGGGREGALCASVLMCYFELVAGSGGVGVEGAWGWHLNAAVSILETMGPENLREGFVHQLFRTVRLGVAFSSVVTGKQHNFASERWKNVPFQGREKTELDVLVDVVLALPSYFSRPSNTPEFRAGVLNLIEILDTQSRSSLALPKINSFRGCLAAIRNAAYLICYSLLGDGEGRKTAADEGMRALESVDECARNAPASSLFLTTCFAREVLRVWGPGMGVGVGQRQDNQYILTLGSIRKAEIEVQC